jgi:hypothetical protein
MEHLPDHRPFNSAGEIRTALAARVRWWLILMPLLAGCVAMRLLAQSDAAQSTLLELGKSIERQLAGGQSHEYHFTLQAGQYARVLAEQRTINVAVAIFGPDGKQLLAGDSYGIGDNEPAEQIAETSGTYRLLVTAPEPTTPPGHYVVKLREIEAATQRHKNRVAAVPGSCPGIGVGNQTRDGLLR